MDKEPQPDHHFKRWSSQKKEIRQQMPMDKEPQHGPSFFRLFQKTAKNKKTEVKKQ